MKQGHAITAAAALCAAAAVSRQVVRRRRQIEIAGKVVLITGGSRGLGFALARELTDQGARVAICARDAAHLEQARLKLSESGADVLATVCDVSDRTQVQSWISEVLEYFGQIDVLINNAGVISVGPLEHQTLADFEEALDIMFWGVVYPTLAALPHIRLQGGGRIVNVTSIGGKVAVPHLLPYCAAKFAAVGFSEGLRAEAAKQGVSVTTVVPGLMRTGSHVQALFKGQHRSEYTWFTLAGGTPLSSIDGQAAARQVVAALRKGDPEIILTWQAGLLARVHGFAPGLTSELMQLINGVLPGSGGIGESRSRGWNSQTAISESPVTALARKAIVRFNQKVEPAAYSS
jgi:NAD(P)-dependent dehydrogenase (short-subunit alcohol dehydrogenase family)